MDIFIGLLFFLTLSFIYILSYYFNQKTKKPKGITIDKEKCLTCPHTGCGHKIDKEDIK